MTVLIFVPIGLGLSVLRSGEARCVYGVRPMGNKRAFVEELRRLAEVASPTICDTPGADAAATSRLVEPPRLHLWGTSPPSHRASQK